ncbi:Arf1l [Monocercomonoides exilis]|uniref:Arf1l n=1 Tax=Monocercomonoides exilis TaxID=2049356 RepID=UPI0035599DD4|nr:Arf1l [Monocercomonoides exilis]|eukprot:MONOS_7574.1-p1 / transcript=MONOS_7574.1 / gene=MONOS_7574 / organism=Monocercomonoides_exilis_PA203 / gene_product=Arf1l / transcript_product=Arf1l / location=Mono_scaffold00262:12457-13103(-) / protein_length=191 / sequence_SO=supercontig / SO=protein_coding / is_pseudo=false
MGLLLSKIVNIFGKSEKSVFMIGLDAAGKTSILYRLKLNEFVHATPTIGFNMENVRYKRFTLTICDAGGNKRIKPLMYRSCKGKDAIIIVVDSVDISRIACTTMECGDCLKEELHYFLQQKEAGNFPLLIYANKQDMAGAVSPEYIREKLELDSLCAGRSWFIQPCSALTGDGLLGGLEWLANEFSHKRK